MSRCLGIVGGVGPAATARLYQALCHRAGSVDRFPALRVANLDFERRAERALVAGDTPSWAIHHLTEALSRNLAGHAVAGADGVALPCNTLHYVLEEAAERSGADLQLFPIPQLVAERLGDAERVLVLCTGATAAFGLYDTTSLSDSLTYPPPRLQREVEALIAASIEGRVDSHHMRARLAELVEPVVRDGCDAVLLGCTDLALVGEDELAGVTLVDSLEVLIDECASWLAVSEVVA